MMAIENKYTSITINLNRLIKDLNKINIYHRIIILYPEKTEKNLKVRHARSHAARTCLQRRARVNEYQPAIESLLVHGNDESPFEYMNQRFH